MKLVTDKNHQKEINLLAAAKLLIKKIWILIISTFIFGAASYGGSRMFIKPQYLSSVTFYINNVESLEKAGSLTTSDLSVSIMLVQAYSTVIKSEVVLNDIIKLSGTDLEDTELEEMLVMAPVANTGVLVVSVVHENPKTALLLAQSVAEVVPKRMTSIIKGSYVTILNTPKLPEKRYAPSYAKLAVLGAIGGDFMTAVAIILFYIMKEYRMSDS